MNDDWREDWEFSERFRAHLSEIIAQTVRVEQAPRIEDWKRNTDYLLTTVVPTKDGKIRAAARTRRRMYVSRYGAEFTVRYRRPSGAPTEMAKMLNGWGDLFVYGFEAEVGSDRLRPWFVGDTQILREYLAQGGLPRIFPNPDGTKGAAFRLAEMPPDFVRNSEGLSVPEEDNWFPCPNCPGYRGRPYGAPTPDENVDALWPEIGDGYGRVCLFCGTRWRSGRLGHASPAYLKG